MRTTTMYFSILQFSRTGIPRFADLWQGSFHSLSTKNYSRSSNFKVLGSKTYGVEGGYSRRWIRRPLSTKTGGTAKMTKKTTDLRDEIFEGTVSAAAAVSLNRTEVNGLHKIEYIDIQQKISENKDLARLVTVIVFDIETTGLSREKERIIEIAFQDLGGGENSTFQTLVNPQNYVPNPHVHGITTHMVNRPDVPRMVDLIPILLQYIRSRQKPGGYVLFVAHNARCFDVPFLIKEFNRCGFDIPHDWLFLDTLALARELVKSEGLKLPSRVSLQALREHYNIRLVGTAHRAMSDVNTLSSIVQKLTFDLKIEVSGLIERSFRASDLTNPSPKKKKDSS